MSEYLTLGQAQDALIELLNSYRDLEVSIETVKARIERARQELPEKEAKLVELSADIKKTLAVVAMGFHMTAKEDPHG